MLGEMLLASQNGKSFQRLTEKPSRYDGSVTPSGIRGDLQNRCLSGRMQS